MASNHALRQASRTVQRRILSSRSSGYPHPSSSSLYTSGPTFRTRPLPPLSHHVYHQARNLSLWPFSKAPEQAVHSTSKNITITEPDDLSRTIRANDTSADLSYQPHKPNTFEPKIIENLQDKVAGAPSSTPPLEDIPERIGYLHEVCGLDFGYGPSSTMMWILEHIHVGAGLSWTASIVCLGLALRAILFPMQIKQSTMAARMRSVEKDMKPLQAKLVEARTNNDMLVQQEVAKQMRDLRNAAGIKFGPMLYPILIQLPFGFGAWRVLRNAAELPVPGFVTEHFYWITDLTISDEYFLLPFASSLLIYLTMRVSRSQNSSSATSDAMAILGKFLPALSFFFMIFQSGAVQLYFLASSSIGLLSISLLTNPTFRRLLKMPNPDGSSSTSPAANASNSPDSTLPFLRTRQDQISQQALHLAALEKEQKAKQDIAAQNISIIDKGVNQVKGAWSGAAETFGKAMGQTKEEKLAQRQREEGDRFEARARQRLEERRRERNQNLRR